MAGQDDYGERNFDDCRRSNNPFTAGVERRSSLSNSVKTITFANPDKKLEHLDKTTVLIQVIEFNNEFFKLLSSEFEQPDYQDLYENHSHQKSNDKLGGYVNISFIQRRRRRG
jgi:hypothetical protein